MDKGTIYNGKYKKICKIGNGAFGCVYKVENTEDNKSYALKKYYLDNLKNDKSNLVYNQFLLLQSLDHINIIKALDYFKCKENQYILFDYYDKDLIKLIPELKEDAIKSIMRQILEGIVYLHNNNIVHRDMKPDNILIDTNKVVKIADFDLARVIQVEEKKPLTKGVATIYYRSPEIFFGSTNYNSSVDMWSIGCILAELISGEPLFKGRNEIEVVCKIFDVMGSVNETTWPGCESLPNYMPFVSNDSPRPLKDHINNSKVSDLCYDLLQKLVVLNPQKRLTANEALAHPFFE